MKSRLSMFTDQTESCQAHTPQRSQCLDQAESEQGGKGTIPGRVLRSGQYYSITLYFLIPSRSCTTCRALNRPHHTCALEPVCSRWFACPRLTEPLLLLLLLHCHELQVKEKRARAKVLNARGPMDFRPRAGLPDAATITVNQQSF